MLDLSLMAIARIISPNLVLHHVNSDGKNNDLCFRQDAVQHGVNRATIQNR